MGSTVEEDQVLRELWLGEGRGSELRDKITPFRERIILAYIDWRDFGLRPWNRSLPAEEIPQFWKDVLRGFRRLDNEAQKRKLEESSKAAQAGKRAPGQAPSEEAQKDYMKYRKQRIEQIETQRKKRKNFLDSQALQRQEEYKRRMQMLATRKPMSPKHKRRRHVRQKPGY